MTIWLLGKLFWTHIRIPRPDCLSSPRPCDLRVSSGGLSRFCLLECKRKRDTQPSNRHICTDISRWWREGKRKRGRQVGFPYRLQTKILIENSIGFLFYFMFFFLKHVTTFFCMLSGRTRNPRECESSLAQGEQPWRSEFLNSKSSVFHWPGVEVWALPASTPPPPPPPGLSGFRKPEQAGTPDSTGARLGQSQSLLCA